MSSFSFDENDAKMYGVNEAIFLNSLTHWLNKNAIDGRNIKQEKEDGPYHVWTYNTHEEYTRIFTWLSASQIYRIIEKLKQADVIHTAHFEGYNRRTWIRLRETVRLSKEACKSLVQQDESHFTKSQNGSHEIVSSISRNREMYNNDTGSTQIVNNTDNPKTEKLPRDKNRSLVVEFCEWFKEQDQKRSPNQKRFSEQNWEKTREEWISVIDKMNRIDGISLSDLRSLHKRVLKDPFWCKQVQSPVKYRKSNGDKRPYFEVLIEKFPEQPSNANGNGGLSRYIPSLDESKKIQAKKKAEEESQKRERNLYWNKQGREEFIAEKMKMHRANAEKYPGIDLELIETKLRTQHPLREVEENEHAESAS